MKPILIVAIVIAIVFFVILIKNRDLIGINPILKYKEYGDFSRSKYKIAIIGGTHGNEPAGTAALEMLVGEDYFDNYVKNHPDVSIRVVPRVNEWGLKLGTRNQLHLSYPDVNRNYAIDERGNEVGKEPTSRQVIELTKDADLVIDLHEGWGYHLVTPSSIGSTLSFSGEIAKMLAHNAVSYINKRIRDATRKFIVLDPKGYPSCDIPSTLRCIKNLVKKDYILIETTGQNDIQPLMVRVNQQQMLIRNILDNISNYL